MDHFVTAFAKLAYAPDQVRAGEKVEAEHGGTIDWVKKHPGAPKKQIYRHIAKDHLDESGKYYSDLKTMEEFADKEKQAEDQVPIRPWARKNEKATSEGKFRPNIGLDDHDLLSRDMLKNAFLEKLGQVDPYQQETQWTCSAGCLHAVLLHWGDDWPEPILVPLIGAKPKRGAETTEIAEAARMLGYSAFEYSFESIDQARVLLDQDIPIICDIQSFNHPGKGHYVVMTGADEYSVDLMDPNTPGNHREISREEMEGRWWDHRMAPPHELMSMWGVVIVPAEMQKESMSVEKAIKGGHLTGERLVRAIKKTDSAHYRAGSRSGLISYLKNWRKASRYNQATKRLDKARMQLSIHGTSHLPQPEL